MDKIKLLQFVTLFLIGGTERHLVNLVRGLNPSGFELYLACLKRIGVFLKELELRGIPICEYNINSLHNLNTLKEQLNFAAYLRRNQIQVVHSYGFYANVFAIPAARLAGTSVVVASIRDSGDIWTPMQRRVQKLVCRFADCVVANAEAVRQRLIAEGYNPDKVAVIRNGVDLSKFARRGNSGIRQELGLAARTPLIAVFSRLNQLKGIEFFLEAAAILAKDFESARFLIIGDSAFGDASYRAKLEQDVARLGLGQRVIFTGFRLDVPELLSETTISVLPSLSEGLSNVLLESMAAGVPVIATRVGGNPEVIEDGVTGLVVPPRDADALARAIALFLRNPMLASKLGHAGKQRVAHYFALDRMVQETERFYLGLLRAKRGQAVIREGRPA